MKKIYLSLIALVFAINFSYAQWSAGTGKIYTSTSTDKVGIGTINPIDRLHVVDNVNTNGGAPSQTIPAQGMLLGTSNTTGVLNMGTDATGSGFYSWIQSRDNTSASYYPLSLNTEGGNVGIGTSTPGQALEVAGNIQSAGAIYVSGNNSLINVGSDKGGGATLKYNSNGNLDITPRDGFNTIFTAGNVGIGTTTPDESLSVAGTVHAKEVKVSLSGLPDYVFKPSYHLLTLPEVKTYINKNHHLPDVPSAAEVEKNGLNLGEMDKVLTKKVEELTLYLIEKEKTITHQQKQLTNQQQQIDALSAKLDMVLKTKPGKAK